MAKGIREIFTDKVSILVHVYQPALKKSPHFIAFANFCGANTPTVVDYKLPM
jgi:hypothetical protein